VCIDAENLHTRVERYWTPEANGQPDHRGAAERLERIDDAFVRAVERRVTATSNLGLSLSGGLDARSLLAVMDHDRVSVRSVCLGMPGSLDHQCSERLAGLVGCPHRNHVLGTGFLEDFRRHLENMVALTDGQYLSQCIVMPTLPLYRELGIEVLLRGHAGELMHMQKAYNYSLDAAALEIRTDAELERWLFRRLQAYMLDGVDRPLFRGDLQHRMTGLAQEALRQDLNDVRHIDRPLQRIWALFVTQRLRRETVLSLVKFRSVVEPRLPYLDNELVDLLLATPPELKLDETIQAYILRKRRPSFLDVVNANTGARVGSGQLAQRLASAKMKVLAKLGVPGYQPYERLGLWLRRELAPLVREILLGDGCLSGGVFAADGVRHVVTQHLENRRNHTFLLLAMMIYELGRRRLSGEVQTAESR
jgi:asparagine synthase (glutamine-hydrolysing)